MRYPVVCCLALSLVAAPATADCVFTSLAGLDSIASFQVGHDGSLSVVAGSPFPISEVQAGAADADLVVAGNRLYVGMHASSFPGPPPLPTEQWITGLDILPNCALLPLPLAAPPRLVSPAITFPTLTTNAAGTRLWAAGFEGRVVALDIQPGGGLAPVAGSLSSIPGSFEVDLSADGTRLLATHSGGVGSYRVAGNGAAAPVAGSPFHFDLAPPRLYPIGAAWTASEGRLYVADQVGGRILGVAVAPTGQLTQLPRSPYAAGPSPVDLLLGASEARLYATDFDAGTITVFDVAADGSLALRSTLAAGIAKPFGLTRSPAGDFLYVVGRDEIAGFVVSPAGALAPLPGLPVPAASPYPFPRQLVYYAQEIAGLGAAIPAASPATLTVLAVLLAGVGITLLGRRGRTA